MPALMGRLTGMKEHMRKSGLTTSPVSGCSTAETVFLASHRAASVVPSGTLPARKPSSSALELQA